MSYEERMRGFPTVHPLHGAPITAESIIHEAARVAAEADAEIQRLREALAASEAGAAELRAACENMLYVMARRGRLDDGDWSKPINLMRDALSSTDAGKRVTRKP